jgi:hypothetical protein
VFSAGRPLFNEKFSAKTACRVASGVSMNAVIYEFPVNKNWQALYKAAIVEADSTKLSDRIAEAKKVIAENARELFQTSGDNFEEEQALDTIDCDPIDT